MSGHKIRFHPGDWYGERGCAECGKRVLIVQFGWTDRGPRVTFFAHERTR